MGTELERFLPVVGDERRHVGMVCGRRVDCGGGGGVNTDTKHTLQTKPNTLIVWSSID